MMLLVSLLGCIIYIIFIFSCYPIFIGLNNCNFISLCFLQQHYNNMSKDHQIKIFDYRNACYQGQAEQTVLNGIGTTLTEDFLFNTSIWKQGVLNGPTFTIFPSQKILYGDFKNNNPDGIFCYEFSKQCQFYFIFKSNKMQKTIIAVFPYIKCVLQVHTTDKDTIESQKQHNYAAVQQKWEIISQIFNFKMPEFMKGYRKFIKFSFVDQFKVVQEIFGDEYYFGMIGEGLGVKMDQKDVCVKSIGYYDENKILKHIGNRLISKQTKVRQQGIYSKPQTLVRYQQNRPTTIKKHYRDYFRLAINFQNKFLHFTNLQNIQKQLLKFRDTLKDNTTRRIAQQLIQHLDEYQRNQQLIQDQKVNNGIKHEPTVKMKQDVSLDELKKQLDRSMTNNKSKGKSPYKSYNNTPAQLKYINWTNQKVDTNAVVDRDDGEYGSGKYRVGERSIYQDKIKKLNYDQNQTNYKRYPEVEDKPKRYPIQQDLKTYTRQNTSKSPIKLQHKPFKYQYTDQDSINPERHDYSYKKPEQTYINRTRKQPAEDRKLSPYNSVNGVNRTPQQRKVTPTLTRADRLSNMYDEQENSISAGIDRQRKYNLNKGRGYHFNDNEPQKQMGLVRTGRKVESPPRKSTSPYLASSPYKAISPYKATSANTNAQYNYTSPHEDYGRNYDNNYERRYVDDTRGQKKNYGYFDRNR